MNFLSILLQATEAASEAQKGGGNWQQIILIGVILVVFYFFLIRPQMKRNKEQKKFREGLQRGQRVITIGGIHGKIEEINDTTIIISVEGGNKLKMEKSAIASSYADQLNASENK
ncbi:MAG: preprotein translocase subunit YajC [Bacteroidales bacterium]|jgi:preprotein translocase subunit YajC|nr:preprotein translocase subunit YajC [Bacteroidales bacterium]